MYSEGPECSIDCTLPENIEMLECIDEDGDGYSAAEDCDDLDSTQNETCVDRSTQVSF